MEYTLREITQPTKRFTWKRLNPCFNGIYSQSLERLTAIGLQRCLNPCFNGIYSQSQFINSLIDTFASLNPCFNGIYSQRAKTCVPLFIVV